MESVLHGRFVKEFSTENCQNEMVAVKKKKSLQFHFYFARALQKINIARKKMKNLIFFPFLKAIPC